MITRIENLTMPKASTDADAPSSYRPVGFVLASIGLVTTIVASIVVWVGAGDVADSQALQELEAIGFGLNTTGFGIIKLGIAAILVGILVRLWIRIEAIKQTLPELKADAEPPAPRGVIETAFGPAEETDSAPDSLPIHRMAKTMWAPMLVMGTMGLFAGLVISWVWAADVDSVAAAAWTQGLQFLGEAMILAGIAFLLGSILARLREGGGAVQQSLGLPVRTLTMPTSAKLFVGLMMLGLMVGVAQFVLYLVVAAGVANPTAWFAWLGPFREFGLAMILSGIVLALATIGTVLGFQFDRIREIITTGK